MECKDCVLQNVNGILEELQKLIAEEYFSNFTSENFDYSYRSITDPYILLLYDFLQVCARSKETIAEFSNYYCLRLVLDEESPLATYFMDLFCYLHWVAEHVLWDPPLPKPKDSAITGHELRCKKLSDLNPNLNLQQRYREAGYKINAELLDGIDYGPAFWSLDHEKMARLVETLKQLLNSLSAVIQVCRDLYFYTNVMLPKPKFYLDSGSTEASPNPKGSRMFSKNLYHCAIRKTLRFQNFDSESEPSQVEVLKDEILGKGSGGSVYKAKFLTIDKQPVMKSPLVAVKMLLHEEDCDDDILTSDILTSVISNTSEESPAVTELKRLLLVQHPNVVRPSGFIGDRPDLGKCGIVMELMDDSLSNLLDQLDKENALLPDIEMVDLMLEIAKGMRFVHECGLMHRDLKPGNILIKHVTKPIYNHNTQCSFLEVKLADFGCTKSVAASVSTYGENLTSQIGTRYYRAPEVLRNSEDSTVSYTEKADVFSFGTTCFNVLTSRSSNSTTFKSTIFSSDFYSVIQKGLKEWMPCVKNHYDGYGRKVPKELADLIEACWQTNPRNRPSFTRICSFLNFIKQKLLYIHTSQFSQENIIDMFGYRKLEIHLRSMLKDTCDIGQVWDAGRQEDRLTNTHDSTTFYSAAAKLDRNKKSQESKRTIYLRKWVILNDIEAYVSSHMPHEQEDDASRCVQVDRFVLNLLGCFWLSALMLSSANNSWPAITPTNNNNAVLQNDIVTAHAFKFMIQACYITKDGFIDLEMGELMGTLYKIDELVSKEYIPNFASLKEDFLYSNISVEDPLSILLYDFLEVCKTCRMYRVFRSDDIRVIRRVPFNNNKKFSLATVIRRVMQGVEFPFNNNKKFPVAMKFKEFPLATDLTDILCYLYWVSGELLWDPPLPPTIKGSSTRATKHKEHNNVGSSFDRQSADWVTVASVFMDFLYELRCRLSPAVQFCGKDVFLENDRLDMCFRSTVSDGRDSLLNLLNQLAGKKALQDIEMVDLMLQIAKGMRFLHRPSLINRRLKPRNTLLKPHNVFLEPFDQPMPPDHKIQYPFWKVTRFNLCEDPPFSCDKDTLEIYRAPELTCSDMDMDMEAISFPEKVDVFSFGTICVCILTCNPNPSVFNHGLQNWDHLVKLLHVRTELISLVEACWQHDPDLRPSFARICSFLNAIKLKLHGKTSKHLMRFSRSPEKSKQDIMSLSQGYSFFISPKKSKQDIMSLSRIFCHLQRTFSRYPNKSNQDIMGVQNMFFN